MSDITEHKWSDNGNILEVYVDDDCIVIDYDENTSTSTISKSDAIAIAQHFGLLDTAHVPFVQIEPSIIQSVTKTSSTENCKNDVDNGIVDYD